MTFFANVAAAVVAAAEAKAKAVVVVRRRLMDKKRFLADPLHRPKRQPSLSVLFVVDHYPLLMKVVVVG